MVATGELHPSVDFATRYGTSTDEYFNAHSALIRANELIEDAQKLSDLLNIAYPEDERWHPWWGAEAMSYYAVGIITCLEWHARSRITDVFTYNPASIDASDLKGRLTEKILPQMLAQNATVAQLLGGSLSVNKFDDYIGALKRVFKEIEINDDIHAWLRKPIDGELTFDGSHFEEIEDIYRFRHMMVHEIGIHVLGHVNVREAWDPETAVAKCTLIFRLMKKIERVVFDHAPKRFPNLVDTEGSPVLSSDYLAAEIKALEFKLKQILERFLAANSISNEDEHDLDENFRISESNINAELRFIEQTPLLHSRYLNLRSPARTLLLRGRIDYLKGIIEMVSGHWGLDSAAP